MAQAGWLGSFSCSSAEASIWDLALLMQLPKPEDGALNSGSGRADHTGPGSPPARMGRGWYPLPPRRPKPAVPQPWLRCAPVAGAPASKLFRLEIRAVKSLPNAAGSPRSVVQAGTAVNRGECAPAASACLAEMQMCPSLNPGGSPCALMCGGGSPGLLRGAPFPRLNTFLRRVPREPAASSAWPAGSVTQSIADSTSLTPTPNPPCLPFRTSQGSHEPVSCRSAVWGGGTELRAGRRRGMGVGVACMWFQLLKAPVLFPSLFLGMQGAGSPPEGLFYKRPWRLSHFLAVTLGPGLSGLLTHGDIGPDGSLRASGGGGSCQII